MAQRIGAVDAAVALLEHEDNARAWRAALGRLAEQDSLHALLAGRVTRLLHDAGAASHDRTSARFHLALSQANAPLWSAHWLEGFLSGGGLILIHDDALWSLVDGWIAELSPGHFVETLPLVRRTFSTFDFGERRRIGERAKRGTQPHTPTPAQGLSSARAARVVPVLMQIYQEAAA
jgi:hypothetical protein